MRESLFFKENTKESLPHLLAADHVYSQTAHHSPHSNKINLKKAKRLQSDLGLNTLAEQAKFNNSDAAPRNNINLNVVSVKDIVANHKSNLSLNDS